MVEAVLAAGEEAVVSVEVKAWGCRVPPDPSSLYCRYPPRRSHRLRRMMG